MKKPLPANPYVVGNPIKSRDMFFGREDDFAFVARKIGENKANQILVLCGERRSGKTSILFQILSGRLGEAFLPVLVDMQMLAGIRGDIDFYRAILKAACAAIGRGDLSVELLEQEAGAAGVERLVEAFLARVQKIIPDRIVLFLLDEYELIEAKIRDGSLSESSIHYLAGILESPFRVSFLFTGSTNLEDRRGDIWKSFLGKSIYRKISYLSRNDAARLITEPVQESVTYSPDLVDAIFRLTGGQPFYTQVVCQNMIDLLMEQGRGDPRAADLERIVHDIVDNPLPQMIYSWNGLGEWNQVVLASLAGRIIDGRGWAGSAAVHRFLLRSRVQLPFKRERINVLLEEAYHAELLEKNDSGGYRYRMDLFRRWIRREHTIWKAAREAHLEFRNRARILPLAAAGGLLLVGLLAVGWFVLVPRFLPSLRGGAHQIAAETLAAIEMKDVTFTANRGPWRLNIDGASSLTSEGQRDQVSIRVAKLASGKHIVVATPREGNPVSTEIDVTGDGQVFKITFEQVSKSSAKTTAPAAVVAPPDTSPAAVPKAPATETAGPVASGATPAAPEEQQAQPAREGSLIITTKPADAAVTLDGQPTGKRTPYMEPIAPGDHVIVLTLEGYAEARVPVTVPPGEQTRLNEIVLVDAWAEITFNVRPTAQIFIDNVHALDTPYAKPWKVRAGTHTVTIKNEALSVDESMTVTLVEGESRTIEKVLK